MICGMVFITWHLTAAPIVTQQWLKLMVRRRDDVMTKKMIAPGPCIYCRSTATREKREHVMSQALGTFEQNWVIDSVCDQCNKYFADNLELILGRDSIEGFLRVEVGVKPIEAIDKFINQRSTFYLQEHGPFAGIRVVMRATPEGMVPDALPQVALRAEGLEWRFYRERELTAEAVTRLNGATGEIRIIGRHGTDDLAALVRRLGEIGLPFVEHERLMDQPLSVSQSVRVLHEFSVDSTLRRAAAKICFNYLAHVIGEEEARSPDFDVIRRFVRYGDELEKLVSVQDWSPLVGPVAATSRAHVCGFQWEPNRQELVGIVTLFNRMTYGIRLSSALERSAMRSIHAFDPITRRIFDLPIAT
jgi:hypothetical protein